MDKLEQYLDRVCRSIGGPRSLRQHIRQELREHLLDAAAQHKAAGLPEEQALDRALEDFGGPEQVRSELEATHGHRLLPVVIDKAMQWKENTLKAKWLWTTWAYLAVVLLIALEVLCITFNAVYIIPKFQKLTHDGFIDPAIVEKQGVSWMPGFLNRLSYIGDQYTTQLLLLAAAAWGLLEWCVKSENKPFIRLSVLGTAAVGLMVVVVLMAGSLVIPFCVAVPAVGRMTRPWAVEQVAAIDTSIGGLEQALAKKDWGTMREMADQASNALNRLSAGPSLASLTRGNEPPTVENLRVQLASATEALRDAQQAIREEDAERLSAALKRFQQSFGPVREASKRPER
ncbi:MAG TPA: permease prefix domain 1-containing protein [Gemmataceae bacterium]|jgi:hypothetical protein